MNRGLVVTWLVATFIGCVAFFLLVLLDYTVREWRRLRAAGAVRAGMIVWKRLAGPIGRIARLQRDDDARGENFVGASVWLEWDQRWGLHGASMGRVIRQGAGETQAELLIETAVPQTLPTGATSAVWFVPSSARALAAHRFAVVRGSLRDHAAPDRGERQDGPLTAGIVVLSTAK